MRIVCVGGGPAGLYFAILMKQSDPSNDITVLERKPAKQRDGWGVVFWEDLLDELRATDVETARRIRDGAVRWQGQLFDLEGACTQHEGCGYGIGRSTLLEILTTRATALGVEIKFDHAINDSATWPDADIVVASDGANSARRQREPEQFKTDVVVGRNKYLWLGTSKLFDPFTFAFVNTRAGWIWCHAYAFDDCTSTFIVECAPETSAGLGLDALPARDALPVLEEIFEKQLAGAPLRSLGHDDAPLPWLNFRTVTNDCWHSGNTVLMGDAAHTTHFSIGSGTRLALQDAMALAAELQAPGPPSRAFAAYEKQRRAALLRVQTEARFSAQWFEDVTRYVDLPSAAFSVLLRARRDPLLPRVPPTLYYRVYAAVERVSLLRRARSWIGPKARALHSRLPARTA